MTPDTLRWVRGVSGLVFSGHKKDEEKVADPESEDVVDY